MGKLKRGARVLPEKLFEKEIKRALSFIETVKDYYTEVEKNGQASTFHYTFFSPIISIFGKRGTGKTAFLYTLVNKLKKEFPNDIVLDPIDPHRFKKGDRLLETILVSLKDKVEKLKDFPIPDKLKKDCPFREGKNGIKNCLWLCYQKAIDGAHAAYRQQDSEAVESDSVFYTSYFQRRIEFPKRFGEFIRCLTELHLTSYCPHSRYHSYSELNPPLLIVPIDDIDLVPEYLEDVSYVIRLLSGNIHRLLLIVTANKELSEMSMTAHYISLILRDIKKGPEKLLEELIVGRDTPFYLSKEVLAREVENLVYQFHLKFFPPDGRIYLEPPEEDEVLNYPEKLFNEEEEKEKVETFVSVLRKVRVSEGNSNVTLLHLILSSPFSLLKNLLPNNWREIEEIYHSLRKEREFSSPVLRDFVENRLKRSAGIKNLEKNFLDFVVGDKIYIELKGSEEELLNEFRIRVTYDEVEIDNKTVLIGRTLRVISPITTEDFALLIFLLELSLSTSSSPFAISPELSAFVYSFLPPPVIFKGNGKYYFYALPIEMLKETLIRKRRSDRKKLDSEESHSLFFPYSLYNYYLLRGLEKKKGREWKKLKMELEKWLYIEDFELTQEVILKDSKREAPILERSRERKPLVLQKVSLEDLGDNNQRKRTVETELPGLYFHRFVYDNYKKL